MAVNFIERKPYAIRVAILHNSYGNPGSKSRTFGFLVRKSSKAVYEFTIFDLLDFEAICKVFTLRTYAKTTFLLNMVVYIEEIDVDDYSLFRLTYWYCSDIDSARVA